MFTRCLIRQTRCGEGPPFGVVEHFEHMPVPALSEAFRVFKKDGVLVLTVPHPQFVEHLYVLRQRVALMAEPRAEYYERTYTHGELADLVRKTGFTIELISSPIGHSYTFHGLHPIFRRAGTDHETSALAETAAAFSRRIIPWFAAFETLIIARK